MLIVSEEFKQAMIAPVRTFGCQVEIRQNENDLNEITILTDEDSVKSIEIQRVGDNSKFYGYGICQRLNLKLVDLSDELQPVVNSPVMVRIGILTSNGVIEYVNWCTFYISQRNRSEDEGQISITAYDKIEEASKHTLSELSITTPYTIKSFAQAIATYLGLGFGLANIPDDDFSFNLSYEEGANFSGTETLREALNCVAEATGTIFFINHEDKLIFKRLDITGGALAEITEDDYFSLTHSGNRRISKVAHVTELGDNVASELTTTGTTVYIRNNPFWDLREDIAAIVDNALNDVGNLTINQFDITWRGNLPLECGDKIDMRQVCLDGCVESAYVLDDVITFDGAFGQRTQWSYQGSDVDGETNPSNIGDAINQTYAKVDKVNRQIDLVASETADNTEKIATIQLNTDSIAASVSELTETVNTNNDDLTEEVKKIKNSVETQITPEDVQIQINTSIETSLENGVSKVETTTGYTFNDEGLTISKSDSQMSTTITEDGMTVFRDSESVLIANNEGVKAEDLHATTFLIIGENSRFEDFERNSEPRTGCFWIRG